MALKDLSSLIYSEIRLYERECNFTERERELFRLRCVGKTLFEIAEIMDYSTRTIDRLNHRVKIKIKKVDDERVSH